MFVDGRARNLCILHAAHKVRLGGYLMLDNSDRLEYQSGIDLLRKWERTDFFGPGMDGVGGTVCWQTTVWRQNEKMGKIR